MKNKTWATDQLITEKSNTQFSTQIAGRSRASRVALAELCDAERAIKRWVLDRPQIRVHAHGRVSFQTNQWLAARRCAR